MFSISRIFKEKVILSAQGALETFNKRRKLLLKLSLQSLALTFLALAIVGMKLLYPFHLIIGFGIYALSFVPLVRRIYFARKTWRAYHSYQFTATFFRKEKMRLVFAGILTICLIAFFWVHPMDKNPFTGYLDADFRTHITDDLYISVTAMDYLETAGNDLLAILSNKQENIRQSDTIVDAFNTFVHAVVFSESLTDTHRYFSSIPYHLGDERMVSFLISYSLYVKKYEIVHRIMMNVSGNEYQKKVLNGYMSHAGRANVYNEMVAQFYAPKTHLRLTGGYLYFYLFARLDAPNDVFDLLHNKTMGSYTYLRRHFTSTLALSSEMMLDTTEQRMFDAWFPIQKNVAATMGHAILTTRGKDGFITAEQALQMGSQLAPGDILLQRRNWHLSNIGIPGFWTHSALYTGDLATMDAYFASEFPYQGCASLSTYLETYLPEVYALYTTTDTYGYHRSVIEAIEPGVVLQSLPVSANADFVVALRPNLTRRDVLLALIEAFNQKGKPYDFNFDFDTSDALVCSELVYNAYLEHLPEKHGLHFSTSLMNGRKIVTPLAIADKYVLERGTSNQELSFVYFLRGSEATQVASSAGEGEFIKTIGWSKFTFLQE
ncbi:MAG: hypothetical protein KBD24_04605 [Candidatus Pacebacteria bacterium]|nr:hypothetical protein [Candidatus Paceibacterota bacterium]